MGTSRQVSLCGRLRIEIFSQSEGSSLVPCVTSSIYFSDHAPYCVRVLRITDALESKTDVRSLGMEGFYSSLLTKNIAMGGNVETHALSAYTAGSGGQQRILPLSRAEPSHPTPAGKEESDGVPAAEAVVDRQESNHARLSPPSSPAREPEPLPAASNEDRIQSARERYLARKRAAP